VTQRAPRGNRLHIGLFGRRNAGKSTLLNALTRQEVAIVSPTPGTTTDPVFKAMEVQPLGPVVFMDTPGGDDRGDLGSLRVGKMRQVFDRADVAVLVAEAGVWDAFEDGLLAELRRRGIPTVVAFSKCDLAAPDPGLTLRLAAEGVPVVRAAVPPAAGEVAAGSGGISAAAVARDKPGVPELRQALLELAPDDLLVRPPILGDLVAPGAVVVLVVPIDAEAPAGRIILPQVQTIRDLLDHDCACVVCRETGLAASLAALRAPPALVVTDSQAFAEVAAVVPPEVPLTSFSILFARVKGDLETLAVGALAIDRLGPGSRVLVAESCTHHPVDDDIGSVKIPRLLRGRAGDGLVIHSVQGHDFPADLGSYDLVIHCGACMTNRREMLSRLAACRDAGTTATNYGMAIAHCLGILDRALAPFPDVRARWRATRTKQDGRP
jgi:[FeFe] hydrogenase H-cluster maturation GTPase HydF